MGNTTFRGVLRFKDGLKHVAIADATGTETETEIVNSSGVLVAAPNTDQPIEYSSETGITAFATGGQTNAVALTEEFNNITICATDGDSVKLPTAVAGLSIKGKNSGATSMALFPNTSDSINALAVNLSINVAPGADFKCNAISDTVWETQEVLVLTAPTTLRGELIFKATDNDADTVTTLTNAAMGQTSIISIPDPGAGTANIVLTSAANNGVRTAATSVEMDFNAGVTLGTGLASKVLTLDSGDDLALPAAGIITAAEFIGDLGGVAMGVGEGSGWAGVTTVSSEITKQGKIVTTHLFLDIAGLVVSTTESDIIGDSGQANSHGGQFALAESGQFISGLITCLVVPTTGVADIDFTVSSASTGVESADVDALANAVILLANTEAWTLGMSKVMALLPDATSDFLYLSAGVAGTPGTYGAGQFLIELIGYEA